MVSQIKLRLVFRGSIFLTFFLAFHFFNSGTCFSEIVDDGEIKIGVFLHLTHKPLAITSADILKGLKSYTMHTNELGGIRGNTITLPVINNNFNIEESNIRLRRLFEEEKVKILFGVFSQSQLKYFAERYRNILIFPLQAPLFDMNQTNIFFLLPSYKILSFMSIDYLYRSLGHKKIALLSPKNHKELINHGIKRRLKQYGANPIIEQFYEPNTIDFGQHILPIIAANPDSLILFGTGFNSAMIIEQARQFGPRFQYFVLSFFGNDYLLSRTGHFADGTIVSSIFPDPNYECALGLSRYRKILLKYFPRTKPSFSNLMGYYLAEVFYNTLYSLDDLTTEAIKNAFEDMKNFYSTTTSEKLFGPNNYIGHNASYFCEIRHSSFLTIFRSRLLRVKLDIQSIPELAEIYEEKYNRWIGETDNSGYFSDKVYWEKGEYIIKVEKNNKNKKRNYLIDEDKRLIKGTFNLQN